MTNPNESLYRNNTLNDVQLAAAYYPILIDLAKHKHCLTYSELVERAKAEYPNNKTVQNAIAVSTGRKLDVVRLFTSERGMPDLSSLIINKSRGECGLGFTKSFDPIEAREKVFAFDWNTAITDFDGFINYTKKAITPRKRIKRNPALIMMSEFYNTHKAQFAPSIVEKRELIIEMIMEGFSAADAFAQASKDTE